MSVRRTIVTGLITALLSPAVHAQIYVDAEAGGLSSGASWADAYVSLVDAINAASSGDEIWVADGTYMPDGGRVTTGGVYTAGSLNRSVSFMLKDGVRIYGGFAGGETSLSERDPATNVTVLSGDLGNNDDVSNAENSWHVVKALGNAIGYLDGFTVTAGNANGPGSDNRGGGLASQFLSEFTVANCRFVGNNANQGGAMFLARGRPTIYNTDFIGNTAGFHGGAISLFDPAFTKIITNCRFIGNSSGTAGGGAIWGECNGLRATNCLFLANSSSGGPAIGGGGAVLAIMPEGSALLTNCTIAGNQTLGNGGGVRATGVAGTNVTLNNCIVWGNSDLDGVNDELDSTGPDLITNSCTVDGVDPDPLFVDSLGPDMLAWSGDEDLRLQAGSPAVNAGDNNLVPADTLDVDADGDTGEATPDLDGGDRIQCALVDQGAFESAGGSGGVEIVCPADLVVECGESTDPNATGLAIAQDACSGVAVAVSFSDEFIADCGGAGTLLRTWSATDSSGTVECTQTILIEDTTAPALTAPADVSVACDAPSDPNATGFASATDGCDPNVMVTFTDSVAPGECPAIEIITRTWLATDACGNAAEATQTIMVTDEAAPLLTVPADLTLECDADYGPDVAGSATATDACDPAPGVTYSDSVAPGPCAGSQIVTRTWTATDACGNATSADQTITLADSTAPVLTIPPDATMDCDANHDPNATGVATAVDNCDAAPTVTYLDESVPGVCPTAQVVSRTWTATDACGNSTSATQMISLVDTTPPTIECPADLEINLDQGSCAASGLNLGSPVAADTCTDVTVSNDAPATFPPGITVVTWTATDACGNTATCEQYVTVYDATAPFLACDLERHLLWPPNHTLVNVGLEVQVDDDCDSGVPPTVVVYSNEDDTENSGSGMHSPDAKDAAPDTLRLRAERNGGGHGRVYLIVVSAEDLSGNVGESTCVVVVPKSRSPLGMLHVIVEGAWATVWYAVFETPPPGYVTVGDGPIIGPNQ